MTTHPVWVLATTALLTAGCLGATTDEGDDQNPDGTPPPSFSPIDVAPGSWVLLARESSVEGKLELETERNYLLGDVGARSEDSFACSAAGGTKGWLNYAHSSHFWGTYFVGRRQGMVSTWSTVQAADAGGTSSYSLLDGTGETPYFFGNDEYGPQATSKLTITPESPMRSVATGRYWCLDGPSPFAEGDYQVSNEAIQGTGLTWTQDLEEGLLLRFQATAELALRVHLEAQDERFEMSPGLVENGMVDATFCSPRAGRWTLVVDEIESSTTLSPGVTGPAWRLTAHVFDASFAGMGCEATWTPTTLVGGPTQA